MLANAALLFVSILLLFIVLEFIVFRFFLVAADNPTPDFVNGVVRFKPGQEGVYRVKNEIEAEFRINTNGWNSGHKEYTTTKSSSKYRIAIIGDSYILALQVAYNKSVAEQLESKLGNRSFQVYRFGIDSAPLSQYLHMLRNEVLLYSPDLVVVNLVHNDFDESYEFKPGVYASSFMKLKIEGDTVSEEVNPISYETPWYNWIRESATWRYLAYRQQIKFGVLRKIILGENENSKKFQANIDVSMLEKKAKNNQIITDYIFRNIKNICDSKSISLLILIDGDRGSIHENIEADQLHDEDVLSINRMAAFVADKYSIEFLDLQNVFKEDYLIRKKPFNSINDGHWNAYAHDLVADTLANYIRSNTKPNALSFEETSNQPSIAR